MTDPSLSNRLVDLAARIRLEHDGASAAIKRGVEYAIAAGELLIEAKAQLQHGQWIPWLRDHCRLPDRTARAYMHVARNKGELAAENGNVADLSLRGALSALTTHLPPDDEDESAAASKLPPRPLGPGEIELPVSAVMFRGELYPRSQVRPDLVDRYRNFLRTLPAIVVNQRHELIDGYHRLEAHRKSGAKTIRARITHVDSDQDHLIEAVKANATHGLQLPLEVEMELQRKRDAAERLALSREAV